MDCVVYMKSKIAFMADVPVEREEQRRSTEVAVQPKRQYLTKDAVTEPPPQSGLPQVQSVRGTDVIRRG